MVNNIELPGTVGTFPQRRAAVEDVWKVEGVEGVDDQLQVSLTTSSRSASPARIGAWRTNCAERPCRC